MKRLLILCVLLAATVGAWFWIHTDNTPSDTLTLYGNVEIHQVELGFRVGGRIEQMVFHEGARVKKGDLLARLDPAPAQDVLRRAQAELDMQRAGLEKMQRGYRDEDILQAQAAKDGALARLRNAEKEWQRIAKLWSKQAVSRRDYDAAQATRLDVQAQFNAASEQLSLMRSGYRIEDVQQQEAAVEAAAAGVSSAATTVEDTALYAPADGVILTRVREPGAVVAAGQTVYTETIVDPVWVRAYVSQPQLGFVRPGQSVLLAVDSAPEQHVRGTVGFISSTAEFTPKTVETQEVRSDLVFRFRVVVDAPNSVMRQGMPVTLTLRKDGSRP